jgi:hypothetical protein
MERSIIDAWPVIVAACVTSNVPVSVPSLHLYAAPIAIVVDEPESTNSVNEPPHDEKAAFVTLD